jgi:hypothetical protein
MTHTTLGATIMADQIAGRQGLGKLLIRTA